MTTYTVLQRKALLNDLVEMAYADSTIKMEESEFILAVGKRMKVPQEEILDLLSDPKTKGGSIPTTNFKRILHFHRIMIVMFIDDNIHNAELQLLHEIALKYGYSNEVVTELLDAMKRFPYGEIPAEELKEIHSRSYN